MSKNRSGENYYPNTATLYSAALEDGDFHKKSDSFAAFMMGLFTPFPEKMQVNRAFGKSMYEEFASDGFKNILDVGAGPMPRGHEWAPDARILYVDHNPDIVQHARKKLREDDNAIFEVSSVKDLKTNFMQGLGDKAFGDERKLAIGSNAVLMFVPDDEIRETFSYLYDWVAPGSILQITTTAITASESHFRAKMIRRFFKWVNAPMFIRNIDNFVSLLQPWEVVKGPMPAWQWVGWPPSKNTAGIGFDIYGVRLIKR